MTHVSDAPSYLTRRAWLEEYFDRTAAQTWARLTSAAPVGRIRASVREGRDRMRALMLGYLPADLAGARVLDAGAGTGMASIELARRGAEVVAVDLSPTLLALADERLPADVRGRITFKPGDMLDDRLGKFDYVFAMDSLIHYHREDMVTALARLAARTERSVVFTFAPRTAPLALMHAVGSLFPRGNRSPRIEPVAEAWLRSAVARHVTLRPFRLARSARVAHGFYTSQAAELRR
ncbi:MAG: magnesium protoporphyrin IX methyltransferase [Gemmatimonadetes bacterium]|nr:magnesium protoporphyrin IX methyltransferase [Gemmatimonadota bacterium]